MEHQTITKARVAFLDTARALCMFWIVGVWHFGSHIENWVPLPSYSNSITDGVLAAFTFISGFFLGGGIKNIHEALGFYKKRIKRFYFLFVLSCSSLYLAHLLVKSNYIVSFTHLLLTLTGLACFVGPVPMTVWYLSMMLFFYFITPFITMGTRKWRWFSSTLICVWIVFFDCMGWIADVRVAQFIPIYCAGLMFEGNTKLFDRLTIPVTIFSGVLGYVFSYFNIMNGAYMIRLVIAISYGVCIIGISKAITGKITERFFNKISYLSMCAYLFHRQFFSLINFLFGRFSYISAYFLVIPVFFLFCFCIQMLYDKSILMLEKVLGKR